MAAVVAIGLWMPSEAAQTRIGWGIVLFVTCFVVTALLIPVFAVMTRDRGRLAGKDLGKRFDPVRSKVLVPESLGIVCGIVFLAALICGQLVFTRGDSAAYQGLQTALQCVTFMMLLGFMDDVLDLKWRYKLILPLVASLPLIVVYDGATTVVLPHFLRFLVANPDGALTPLGTALSLVPGVGVDRQGMGALVDLGPWYLVFVCMLAIFCTNAINIYAGVNGLEAGQAFVIAMAVLATNLLELAAGAEATGPHMQSAALMLPFCGVTLALLLFNLCPASVFVGDTFCYFAGMTLAVAGIQGHFSKTLLLFFAPQVLNFVYSVPQILKIVPCPRHRLPWVDEASGLMVPSQYEVERADGSKVSRDNMTLICIVLRLFGPLSEASLVRLLLLLQVVACMAGIWLRFYLSPYTRDVEAAAAMAAAMHGAEL